MTGTFCVPTETTSGGAKAKVAAKLARLLNALDDFSERQVKGNINAVVLLWRTELIARLRAEDWEVHTHPTKSAWVVKPPR
jgi:hypothetical protein